MNTQKKSVNVPHRLTVLQRLTVQQYVECGSVQWQCSAPLPYGAPRSVLCLNINARHGGAATELNEETTCSSRRVTLFQSEKGYIFCRCEFQKG